MIDTISETIIPLGQVPAEIPSSRPGRKVAISTVWRWAARGSRGVVLETIAIGGRRYTSREALQRFAERLSQPRATGGGEPPPTERQRTVAQRERDSAKAGKQLEAMGA